ncbi:MAG: AAA family ATPase [candidate division Zixibacteria bacterium]|nr:AAA family ATPase [candidate division Zixibacteria bacterium]
MARIFPEKLTDSFTGYNISGERKIFENALRNLSDSYYIFHDIRWYDPSLDDSHKEGQTDFIIAHAEYGFICVEVKGGRCSYDPAFRIWQSMDRNEVQSIINDPFEQAAAASRVVRKLLSKKPALINTYIPSSYCVFFPECRMKKNNLRGDINSWQILDMDDLFDFSKSIRKLLLKAFNETKIPANQGQLIINGLKEIWGTKSVEGKFPEYHGVRDSYDKLTVLTNQQHELLKQLRFQKRLLIKGCAGSGKTTMAIHKAKIAAGEGKEVLLLCFNNPLGKYLNSSCAGFKNITAGSFFDTCIGWLREAGVSVEPEGKDDKWWTETLPDTILQNIDGIDHRFDAIIVDEGQDFKESYWIIIQLLLSDEKESLFYVFADSNQNIYRGSPAFPIEESPVVLERNVRNTNQIFDFIKALCGLDDNITPSGIDGPGVKILEYGTEEEMVALIEENVGKLYNEGIPVKEVTVLGTKSQAKTSLKYGELLGALRLVEQPSEQLDLRTMTIHRFKGLESKVIILCELNEKVKKLNEVLYIGMTRAICLLIIMAETPLYNRINS